MASTTGIITNTGTTPATTLVVNLENDNLSFSSTIIYHVYVWNSSVSKALIYSNTLVVYANTSQILSFSILGNTSYEVQFLVTGQVPTDMVITVFGTDSSGNVIPHQKVSNSDLTAIAQLNP